MTLEYKLIDMGKLESLTSKNYWDGIYVRRSTLQPANPFGKHSYCTRKIFEIKARIGLEDKRVLEIGGGGSAWLAFLAKKYPSSEFTCLDFSEAGLSSLRVYSLENELQNIKFVCADMFEPPHDMQSYDFVFSHGVVEHFTDLPGVLTAHSKFLGKDGQMLTIIPNMSGLLGGITKAFNREIYDIHVPHDLASFRSGHQEAKLDILECGYLCSSNFGVLSSCFERRSGVKWSVYKFLTRVSKAFWIFEDKVVSLPTSKVFSPYIYVVSKRRYGPAP
jgi:ubiquinone/menaquinone biosynthesis C-methylase UbiE